MNNSLPTLVSTDYWEISAYNEKIIEEKAKNLEPEFWLLARYIKETKVNPEILWRVVRGINNLWLGTKAGRLIIFVNGTKTTVQVREDDIKALNTLDTPEEE